MKEAQAASYSVLKIHEELRLRPYAGIKDAVAAQPWYSDREVLRMSEGMETGVYDSAAILRMYSHLSGAGELYMIEVLEKDGWRPIGDAALLENNLPITIGDAHYRSRGIGRCVLDRLIGRAREKGWQMLKIGMIYSYNERSRRLYTGAGFVPVCEVVDANGNVGFSYERKLQP
ncbi:hypothetical protein B9G55_14410 [Saccharibacillus sp. O16]|nr:hypothetical protein B9G55_14410 [Saccharibacillus sp. O16]